MKDRILGLDTGTNSLGWAIVDREKDGSYSLVDKGVIIFQEGVKIEKGIESSKASERTAHRALRRMYFRRRLRKIEVLKVLIKYNLCPALTEEDLKLWHTRKVYPKKDEFMLWQRTSDDEDINPYHSRYICLTEKLDMKLQADRYTLGRALYHMAQRRGFKSNRLDASEESSSGAVKTGISDLTREINEAGCKYLGEYFYKLYSEQGNSVRIRTRYIDREQHYKAEFDAICAKQQLSKEMIDELNRALYFQRPLESQRQSVGKCTFEKNKARCSESHPFYEEYRMLSFLNNVKVKGPKDDAMRPLNTEELALIDPLFYRKSKQNFDFEDIAKKIAGKDKYQWVGDASIDKPYKFNYRMSQGVSGCYTIAQLREVFGDNWKQGITEVYNHCVNKEGDLKCEEDMICDVWNVLYFFDSKEKLKEFGILHLQLSDELAEKFSNIKLNRNFASLSLKAIRNILPFLRMGMIYSHAVFMAKIPDLVGCHVWDDEERRQHIISTIMTMAQTPEGHECEQRPTLEYCIKSFLNDEYNISNAQLEALYHPSMIETYPNARPNEDGLVLLGSPRTNAVRNPMAMRSLHEVRRLVNTLIKEGKIDSTAEVHIEYARSLNNANMRAAISNWQRSQDKQHKQYADEICKLYKEATGKNIDPTDSDILKYQLWEEQKHICLYTGKSIGIADFIGAGPTFDIEHTIPRSVGGDSTQENMTLCDSNYNRFTKGAKIPSELANHDEILERLAPWKEKIDELTIQIDRLGTRGIWDKGVKDNIIRKKNLLKMERDYWRGKYQRFTMTEVPEGFARRQGAGIGLISKYAALYLKSYFHDPSNPDRRQVYSVKGPLTAEFRKLWGIQEEYQKKSRDSHTHHCIDAVVIACIGKNEFNMMSKYYHDMTDYSDRGGNKPQFTKPWESFTQDMKQIIDELLVVHDNKDNMPKKASRLIDTTHGKKPAKGDCARGSLHLDTYYGAIQRDDEIAYVVRKTLTSSFTLSDADKIVDEVVREKVKKAFVGKALQLPVYMNEEKGIEIKKVRCYAADVKRPLNIRRQRDLSTKEYKQQIHVKNDSNYCMAIYEQEMKGKTKRDFALANMLDAATYFRRSTPSTSRPLFPEKSAKDYPLKQTFKIGDMVLLYEANKEELFDLPQAELSKRLYSISGLSTLYVSGLSYGTISLTHHQEARASKDIPRKSGAFKSADSFRPGIEMLHTQLNALVSGQDFFISPAGKISFKK